MFLDEKLDSSMLIMTIVCFALVLLIMIFALVMMIKRKMEGDPSSKANTIDMKLFKATLNIFYDAVGGMGNVTKIELDEEKNRLVVGLEDVNLAKKLDKLAKFNMYKSEIEGKDLILYFVDSKGFYNSLFGK